MRRSQEPTDTESLAAADEVATAAQGGAAYWSQGKARGGIRPVKIRRSFAQQNFRTCRCT